MSMLKQVKASMNPTTFSKEFLYKQFAKMDAKELKSVMKIGGEKLDGDYTKDEMIQLILWGNRPSSKIRGSFHAWIYDKKTKKIIDDYADPSTYVGTLFNHLQKIHNLPDLRYEEFEKNPKFVETLLTNIHTDYKDDWFKKYMNSENWDRVGYCLQRAFLKHKSSKNRYKIRFGWVYAYNNITGKEMNIEGDDERDDDFINTHIQAVQDGYLLHKRYDRKMAAALLQFFARIDNNILEKIIDGWEQAHYKEFTILEAFQRTCFGGNNITSIMRNGELSNVGRQLMNMGDNIGGTKGLKKTRR
jgi:hypothetical protein